MKQVGTTKGRLVGRAAGAAWRSSVGRGGEGNNISAKASAGSSRAIGSSPEVSRLDRLRRLNESKRRGHGDAQHRRALIENAKPTHTLSVPYEDDLEDLDDDVVEQPALASTSPLEEEASTSSLAAAAAETTSQATTSTESPQQPDPHASNPDVYVVNTVGAAQRVVALLSSRYRKHCFACDTEVADIDVKTASPVGHGSIISFSLYCGPEAHFGVGQPKEGVRKNKVWVDLLDCDDRKAILSTFQPFLEDNGVNKVWHNYGFDKHIFKNEGISCGGFFGDTMHMARLFDSSRTRKGGYTLASLSGDAKLMGEENAGRYKKTTMKELFGKPNIKKDGTEGKLVEIPPVDELQRDPETRAKWIKYSALDAEATWHVHQCLEGHLFETPCVGDGVDMVKQFGAQFASQRDARTGEAKGFSMYDFYQSFWRPFGDILTAMEHRGVLADQTHLRAIQDVALVDQKEARDFFQAWASERVKDAEHVNVGSALQIRQLLFAGTPNAKTPGETVDLVKTFKVPNDIGFVEEGKTKPKKNLDIELHGLWGRDVPSPLVAETFTPSGWPASTTPVLRGLAGKQGAAMALHREGEATGGKGKALDEGVAEGAGLGKMYEAMGGGWEGVRACAAIDALCDIAAIDTLLSNFIIPLQGDAIKCEHGRIHCSMNINTETGRLSARRPNLQNQPALEKDRYRIRKSFTADVAKGKTLIVADYGQLELRLLAHMTSCKSMLSAFEEGGDFHSRTALGMYEHIQEAVDRGECLLEWKGGANGEPSPVPLIKDMFATERRKAKVLNFSIAYGKTAHGLAKDWKVSLKEAEETLKRWYRDRPEVEFWQEQRIVEAHQTKMVRTLLGRQRHLHQINSRQAGVKKHMERAAINTPIQGGAADIAMLAMIEIENCEELKELGWELLLQIHDEVMLEGPEESKARALELVRQCMEHPFAGTNPLQVALSVDAKTADTWYEAK